MESATVEQEYYLNPLENSDVKIPLHLAIIFHSTPKYHVLNMLNKGLHLTRYHL